MYPAVLSTKHAKHAKPAFHPARSHLSAGLTAALLPLCMAAPALADSAPTPAAASTNFAAPNMGMPSTPDGAATPAAQDAGQDAAAVPSQTTPAEPTASPEPSSAPEQAAPVAQPSPSSSQPTEQSAKPAAKPAAKQTTVLRISGPRGTVAPGRHQVAVRLLADDRPVHNGYVRIEAWSAKGWTYAGRLLTRHDGLGWADFTFGSSTKVRALYEGSQTRTAQISRELPISVAKQQAGFRQEALQVAASLNGTPYHYGSTGPSSFDCSGFTGYVFNKVGKRLPRTSGQQRGATQRISKSQVVPGDLLFFSNGGRVGHVAIYAGGGQMWDAPSSGGRVSKRRVYSGSYSVGRIR